MQFICQWCGHFAVSNSVEWLDSGTVLTCSECGGETVVDLDRPTVRAERHKLAYLMSQLPRHALETVLYPDSTLCLGCAEGGCDYPDCDCSCHVRVETAHAMVQDWIQKVKAERAS